ncbi:pentapeptide repeat-containing protein [Streptomyces sp. enrichment culture]|uniref:pentapeptide repeat-containing protein n=1 Tax=Streptomyces sp. enrichment culture TaxID=1795815 RepID=UPI003F560608
MPGESTREALDWPPCEAGGCRGRRVEPYGACLAHLDTARRAAYLASLAPGADLDHRGTPFTQDLLDDLLTRLRDPATGRHRVGNVDLDEARFGGDTRFHRVDFTGVSSFGGAAFDSGVLFVRCRFEGDVRFGEAAVTGDAWFEDTEMGAAAWFYGARIGGALRFAAGRIDGDAVFDELAVGGDATFSGAEFRGTARFEGADIGGAAWFDGARFEGDARFDRATIRRTAWFDGAGFGREACFASATLIGDVSFPGARFDHGARFTGATIGGDADFSRARIGRDITFRRANFANTAKLGPLVLPGRLDLSGAVFQSAVTIEAAADSVRCRRTRWASSAALRLRHATVDLGDAVLEFPVSVAGRPHPFVAEDGEEIDEQGLTRRPLIQVTSVSGVDAAHLVLHDADLTRCLFVGAVHLDQLRLEGRCPLAGPPPGLRWTRRRTLAEEHHWRAARHRCAGWTGAPEGMAAREPAVLAPVYRQLRKALEDGRNEPGAADFYYGEMEMRRHDAELPRSERALLHLYWAACGYGLRAARALGWLLLSVTVTVLAMMLWGLPQDDPRPRSTGTVTGGSITLITDTPDPVNPQGPYSARLSTERFEKGLRVVINSVVFRSSGQELTTAGTYVEMASRVVEPALLGLAALALRSRVKR